MVLASEECYQSFIGQWVTAPDQPQHSPPSELQQWDSVVSSQQILDFWEKRSNVTIRNFISFPPLSGPSVEKMRYWFIQNYKTSQHCIVLSIFAECGYIRFSEWNNSSWGFLLLPARWWPFHYIFSAWAIVFLIAASQLPNISLHHNQRIIYTDHTYIYRIYLSWSSFYRLHLYTALYSRWKIIELN